MFALDIDYPYEVFGLLAIVFNFWKHEAID